MTGNRDISCYIPSIIVVVSQICILIEICKYDSRYQSLLIQIGSLYSTDIHALLRDISTYNVSKNQCGSETAGCGIGVWPMSLHGQLFECPASNYSMKKAEKTRLSNLS